MVTGQGSSQHWTVGNKIFINIPGGHTSTLEIRKKTLALVGGINQMTSDSSSEVE